MKAQPWLKKAQAEGFAIGAFNAGSLETLKAIVGAAKKLSSPVIVEASHGEVDFFGLHELVAAVRALEKDTGVPIILNLDHARTYLACHAATEAGFDYIHFDGSGLPYGKNVEIARMVVGEAHAKGLLVEGEMDAIGGSSADWRRQEVKMNQQPSLYTDSQKAAEFCQATGVDTFAAFIGNVHGLYGGEKKIDLPLLARVQASLPGKFLSLHGGSGIPAGDIKVAIKRGIVKINVNSELRVAFRDTLKRTLAAEEHADEVAIYKIMPAAIKAVQKIVEDKILLFGSAGKI